MDGALMTYRTLDGDVLDAIAYKHMGSADGVHALLRENPRLAEYGPVLPAGLIVRIPDTTTAAPKATVRLWGNSGRKAGGT